MRLSPRENSTQGRMQTGSQCISHAITFADIHGALYSQLKRSKMPIDYKEYHPKWTLIVRLIRKREGDRCKFCRLHNHEIIIRIKDGLKTWRRLCGTEWDWWRAWRHDGY